MKNAIYAMIFVLAGCLLGYSYDRLTIDKPATKFKEVRVRVEVNGTTAAQAFTGLEKDHYLLNLKSPEHKQTQPEAVYFNGTLLKIQKSRHLVKKGMVLSEIPARLLGDKENVIKIIYPRSVSAQMSIILRNYRKSLNNNNCYLLFSASKYLAPPGAGPETGRMLGHVAAGIAVVVFIFAITHIFIGLCNLPVGSPMKLEVFSLLPAIILLLLFTAASRISPFPIIFDKKYFLQIMIIPVVVLKIFLIYWYAEHEKARTASPDKKTRSAFSLGRLIGYLSGKFGFYAAADKFIILFVGSLFFAALLTILNVRVMGEYVASFAYFCAVIGTVMKLVQLAREEGNKNAGH